MMGYRGSSIPFRQDAARRAAGFGFHFFQREAIWFVARGRKSSARGLCTKYNLDRQFEAECARLEVPRDRKSSSSPPPSAPPPRRWSRIHHTLASPAHCFSNFQLKSTRPTALSPPQASG